MGWHYMHFYFIPRLPAPFNYYCGRRAKAPFFFYLCAGVGIGYICSIFIDRRRFHRCASFVGSSLTFYQLWRHFIAVQYGGSGLFFWEYPAWADLEAQMGKYITQRQD